MRVLSLPRGSQKLPMLPLYGAIVFATLLAITLSAFAYASSAISQGYSSEQDLSLGAIVSLEKNTNDTVIASSASNADNILGVVVNRDSSLLSVTNNQKEQIQIATSGITQVLVSDINGPIKRGDHITASPLSGIGMRASANVRIVGIAQGDAENTKKQTYKDKAGKEQSVTLGDVPVLVNVSYFFKEPEKTVVPTAIQSVANSLAGKEVSTLPIVLATAVFLIMLIIVSSIIYSMIKSSIISVGRNPMAQSAVYRDLIQLSALVLAILAVGLIAIYLILTRL
ncbi:MAG: hypothetical protein ABIR46_04535 [Candidatus Saccharimonadales bacterium]